MPKPQHPEKCDCKRCLARSGLLVITTVYLAQNPFSRIEDREKELRRNLKTR